MLFGCFGQSQQGKRLKKNQSEFNSTKARNAGVKRGKALERRINTSDWLTKEHEFFGPLSEWRDNFLSQSEDNTLQKQLNTTIISLSIIIPRVPCVFLESKSKKCNFLVCHCVKKTVHNSVCKSSTLIFVHSNNLIPVGRNLREIEGLAKVHKIQYVFLEATPTKTWQEKRGGYGLGKIKNPFLNFLTRLKSFTILIMIKITDTVCAW